MKTAVSKFAESNWLSLLVFSLLILNTVFVYSNTRSYQYLRTGNISMCMVCPWYQEEKFLNVPLLLFAGALLAIRFWWCRLLSAAISGYLILWGANYLFWQIDWFATWKFTLETEGLGWRDIFLLYDFQFLLAIIVFLASIFSLGRSVRRKTAIR